MKSTLIYSLILCLSVLGFYACSEEDDDPVVPASNSPAPGSGGGAGTGGGTGSGGIPPNSMKVTVDGNVLEFDTVSGFLLSGDVFIFGNELPSNFPGLEISMSELIAADTFLIGDPGAPSLSYFPDSNTTYNASKGYIALRTADTSRNLVNGRFEVVMFEENDPSDSLVFTKGQFNKFYD